jgi:ABC-type multidrug transport system ATPase subunit
MIQQLEADGIQLQFGGRVILSDVYLSCSKGSILGLLGRNGSGKSCLLQVIFGSLSCEKSIRINRTACNEAYKNPNLISYLPQFHFIPNSLSLKEIFDLYALDYSIFGLQFPSINIPMHQAFRNLSGGEKTVDRNLYNCRINYTVCTLRRTLYFFESNSNRSCKVLY